MEIVKASVKVLGPVVSLLAASVFGAEIDLPRVLKSIETRYNTVKTLEMDFQQTYIAPNKVRRTESGRLFLRKPGRMRWQYAKPDGKLFVSNGTDYWYYSPAAQRAEKMKLKEAEDMQAPLAFLIGKLDFQRDFERFVVKPEGDLVRITAQPRDPNKAPYREVSFLAAADARIQELTVRGQDASLMDFRFQNETRNPAQRDSLYVFIPPKGVEVVIPGKEQ
ncbi:MAG: outer membrane lipoprotein chaperone LolA [Acidobacteria bacterium]|nr:outer membrane lipoprotein chaperone LolA [Acidobacteriota bacterium]